MTSVLYEKYKESFCAAEMLKSSCYSSTVNRAYYACVQFILDVLYTKLQISPTDFYSQRIHNKEGTHSAASKLIILELAKNTDKSDYKWFQREFPQFQSLREKADYSEESISQSNAEGALRTAESLIRVVNTIKIKK